MQIFKYELPVESFVTVSMPEGAKVLTVQPQRGAVTMWAEVDPKARRIDRRFQIVGTGHQFDSSGAHYLGSVNTGVFMWHVYELPN